MNVIANMILIISPFILPVIALIGIALNKISSKEGIVFCTSDENTDWYCHSKASKGENRPCFTFDQIKTFYYTAPEKWYFQVYDIYYLKDNDYFKKVAITVPTKEDYILTLRFFKEQEEKKREQKRINATLELLPYLREDAKKAQDEADKMLAKCEKDVQDIAKNLEREKRLTYENSLLM